MPKRQRALFPFYGLYKLWIPQSTPVIMSDAGIKRLNWGNGITLTDKTTVEDITDYIDFKINKYTKYNFKDKNL
jgi:hypothetical protein